MRAASNDQLAQLIESGVRDRIAWAAFEPNGPKLWARIRRDIGGFMQELFEQGAFQGQKRKDAYFVKCDASTMTQSDIDQGILIVVIGVATVRPAEFVIITIGQMTKPKGGAAANRTACA
jgi:phage tail sheath protein FI